MTDTLTKTRAANLMAKAGIVPVSLTGRGTDWEVELEDDKAYRKFRKHVAKLGGYKCGWGGWVLRPNYKSVDMGDWNDRSSRWHY